MELVMYSAPTKHINEIDTRIKLYIKPELASFLNSNFLWIGQ